MNWMYLIFATLALCVLSVRATMIMSERIPGIRKPNIAIVEAVGLLLLGMFINKNIPPDTAHYMDVFLSIRRSEFQNLFLINWEAGFLLLSKAIGFLTGNAEIFKMIVILLISAPIFYRIVKDSDFPELSLLIYVSMGFWMISLGVYRQYMAISILTFSYQYIEQRKIIPSFALFALAFLFHRTAVVFIPVYFLYGFKLNIKMVCLFFGIGALLTFSGDFILTVLNYFARMPYEKEYNGGIPMLIVLALAVCIGFYALREELLENAKLKLYFLMLLCALAIQPLSFTFSIASRLVQFFSFSLVIILPAAYKKLIPTKKYGIAVLVTDVVLIGCLYYMFAANGVVPYYF